MTHSGANGSASGSMEGSSAAWTCRDLARVLAPYLDGELDAANLVDAEAHLGECEACRERVQLGRAMRGTLKKVVQTSAPSPLRARIATAMAAEANRSEARAQERARARWMSSWRSMVPLAGAAAVGLTFFAARDHVRAGLGGAMHAGVGNDLVAALANEHAHPLPPEQTQPDKVRALEQYVGVPVLPARFGHGGARLVGARVLPVQRERAAMLQYEVGQGGETRRVSVFVFDPRRIQVNDEDLAPRAVGTASVRVGSAQGYSVAVMQRGGVGYAVASDLDLEKSAQLAVLVGQE